LRDYTDSIVNSLLLQANFLYISFCEAPKANRVLTKTVNFLTQPTHYANAPDRRGLARESGGRLTVPGEERDPSRALFCFFSCRSEISFSSPMKPILCFFLLLPSAILAQENQATSPVTGEVTPAFEVLSSVTKREVHVEPAPLLGMVPVVKEVNVTVEMVKDPQLPIAPVTSPSATMSLTEEQRAELRARWLAERGKWIHVQLSATVYDHKRTFLRWYPQGNLAPQMTAWSNVDFNVFCGLDRVTREGKNFSFMMLGIENVNTEKRRLAAARRGVAYEMPAFPDALLVEQPVFVVVEGDATDAEALAPLVALHEWYGAERVALHEAYAARLKAQAEREAWLRANPPEPQDVLIRFWKTETQQNSDAPAPTITPLAETPVTSDQ
jgi:hypothetical protein